jgi:HD-like signal output (HDOD) protein
MPLASNSANSARTERIAKDDPVAQAVGRLISEELETVGLEIPRLPHVASRILECLKDSNASTKDVLRHVRMDPVIAGKLIEMANSAAFAGSQHVFSLKMAVIRLGLRKVSEVAFDLSADQKAFHHKKRGHILTRLWKYSTATAIACEELSKNVSRVEGEAAFLTGLFHAVAKPAIVNAIGKLERTEGIPSQNEARVMALLDHLSTELTAKIVRNWNLPKTVQDAVRLQDLKTRDRRDKPLAHVLVCAKLIAADLGIGVRQQGFVIEEQRDFKMIGLLEEERLDVVRDAVQDKIFEIAKD